MHQYPVKRIKEFEYQFKGALCPLFNFIGNKFYQQKLASNYDLISSTGCLSA
jgi:hypothetical protein